MHDNTLAAQTPLSPGSPQVPKCYRMQPPPPLKLLIQRSSKDPPKIPKQWKIKGRGAWDSPGPSS